MDLAAISMYKTLSKTFFILAVHQCIIVQWTNKMKNSVRCKTLGEKNIDIQSLFSERPSPLIGFNSHCSFCFTIITLPSPNMSHILIRNADYRTSNNTNVLIIYSKQSELRVVQIMKFGENKISRNNIYLFNGYLVNVFWNTKNKYCIEIYQNLFLFYTFYYRTTDFMYLLKINWFKTYLFTFRKFYARQLCLDGLLDIRRKLKNRYRFFFSFLNGTLLSHLS